MANSAHMHMIACYPSCRLDFAFVYKEIIKRNNKPHKHVAYALILTNTLYISGGIEYTADAALYGILF